MFDTLPANAAAYLRVSTEEQKDRQSIENQRAYAETFAKLHDITIVDWYPDDGVSGGVPLEKRPEGARLLADARAGRFKVVLVYRTDRLARSTLELLRAMELFDKAGVSMRSMTEPFETTTPTGRFVLTMLGSIAQLEKEAIKERSRQGMERLAREGRWNGGKPPYGYRVADDGRLGIDEEQAAVVRRIFHLYTQERLGTVLIAELLTAEGVTMPKVSQGVKRKYPLGAIWDNSTISRILKNRCYIGSRIWGRLTTVREEGEITGYIRADPKAHVPSEIPSIVDDETFDAAQRLLETNFAWSKRNTKRDYLLRGLIRCARCGRLYSGVTPSDRHVAYYLHRAYPDCSLHRINLREIEETVWKEIRCFALHPDAVIERFAEQVRAEEAARVPLEREFGGVEEAIAGKMAERRRLIALARRGVVTEAEAAYELDQLQSEIDTLDARRANIFQRTAESQSARNRMVSAAALLAEIRNLIDREDFPSRREVVERLIERVVVHRDGADDRARVRYRFDPPPL